MVQVLLKMANNKVIKYQKIHLLPLIFKMKMKKKNQLILNQRMISMKKKIIITMMIVIVTVIVKVINPEEKT